MQSPRNVCPAVVAKTEHSNTHTPLNTDGCSSTKLLTDANSAQDLNLPLLSSGLLQLGSSQWESVLQGSLLAMLTLDLPDPGSSCLPRNNSYRSDMKTAAQERSAAPLSFSPRLSASAVPHKTTLIPFVAAKKYLGMDLEWLALLW